MRRRSWRSGRSRGAARLAVRRGEPRPGLEAGLDVLRQARRLAAAPILPREIGIPAAPADAVAVVDAVGSDERQITDGDDRKALRLRFAGWALAATERADLPGGAKLDTGLVPHPEAQRCLEAVVLAGREQAAGERVVAALLAARRHDGNHGLVTLHGKDCRIEADGNRLHCRCRRRLRLRLCLQRIRLLARREVHEKPRSKSRH